MISTWKQELSKRASELFARGTKAQMADDPQKVIDDLHRKIGQRQVEWDFFCRAAGHLPPAERRTMITPNAALPISRRLWMMFRELPDRRQSAQ
jgi:hypothetical protein